MKFSIRLFSALLTLCAGLTLPAAAAPDIKVEGWDGVGWPNIDDDDLNANQAVTTFGDVDVGTEKERRYRITNTGNTSLTIDGILTQDLRFLAAGINPGTTIGAGNSREFTVTFVPSAFGDDSAVITINNNDPDAEDPYTFAVEGRGVAPEINLYGSTTSTGTYYSIADGDNTPENLNATSFGTIAAGTTRTYYFKVLNSGNKSLNVAQPTFSGTGASSFSVQSLTSAINLGAGNDRLFEIRFQPATAGTKTAVFNMGNNDPSENPFTFTVTGTATGVAAIEIQGNESGIWNDINDGDTTPDQAVTNFGNVDLGVPSLRYYRIRNTGTDTLTISSFSSSNPVFSIASLLNPASIAPGVEEVIHVFFTPVIVGETTTTLTFNTNIAGGSAAYTFALKGTGHGPEINIAGSTTSGGGFVNIIDGDNTPASNDGTSFGTTPIGTPLTRYFRITNSGTAGLNVQAPVLSGTGAGHFSVQGVNSAFNIGSGNTRDFEIRFDPSTVGAKTATFSLSSDDPNESPYTFTVSGSATGTPSIIVEGFDGVTWPNIDDGDLDASQTVTNFGSVNPSTTGTRTFRVRNQGTSTLTISSATSSRTQYVLNSIPNGTSISPGAERHFTVDFSPTAHGVVQTIITINSNTPGALAAYTFGLTGKGKGPEIKVEIESFATNGYVEVEQNDFSPHFTKGTGYGEWATLSSVSKDVRITNTGDAGLDISLPFLSGPDSAHFRISGISGLTNIAAGNDRVFKIHFEPQSAGTKEVQVLIPSNDGDESTFTFEVIGIAVNTPDVQLERYNGISWVDANYEEYDFGNVEVGGAPKEERFRLRNTGTAAAVIPVPVLPDDQFVISGLPSTLTLNPGAEDEFLVTFTPVVFNESNTWEFFEQGEDLDNLALEVKGTGIGPRMLVEGQGSDGVWRVIQPGATTAQITDGTEFGSWDVAFGNLEHQFRITNTGNRPLPLIEARLYGVNRSDYSIHNLDATFNPNYAPGEVKNFQIRFNPDTTGLKSARMVLNGFDNEDATEFALRGTGAGYPEIEVKGHSGSLDPYNDIANGTTTIQSTDGTGFGNVNVTEATEVHTFKIKNTGTQRLVLDAITENSPHFSISGLTFPKNVAPDEEVLFNVTFNPSAWGSHTATVTIDSNDGDESEFTFNVRGSGRAPDIEVRSSVAPQPAIADGDNTPDTSDETDFGVVGTSAGALTRTFILANTGNEQLNVVALSTANNNSSDFILTSPALPIIIAAGATVNFQIAFDPATTGYKYTSISLTCNDPDSELHYSFRVGGTGGNGQPEIEVLGDNSTSLTSGQTAVSATAGTDFGTVTAGSGSATRTYTINNTGTGNLVINSITDDAPAFAVSGIPASVPALGSASFTVTYSPATANVHTAVITISNNDSSEGLFTFTVRGTGSAAPPPPKPEIDLFGGDTLTRAIGAGDTTPTRAKGTDFGDVETGSSLTKTFRIRNTGTATLTISGAAFASAPRYTIAGLASSIPAGGFDDFTVTFAPVSEGPATRVLTITSNDDNEGSYAVSFTGNAVAAPGLLDIVSLEPAGNKVTLTFVSIPNRTYRILRSSDMQTWTGVSGMTGLAGDAAPQSYTMARGTDGRRYWRVDQE